MKQLLLFMLILAIAASCANNYTDSAALQKAREEIGARIDAIFSDTTLTEEQHDALYEVVMRETYNSHKKDSLGLEAFVSLVTNFCEPEEAAAMYEEADDFIRENTLVKTKILSIKNLENVKSGCKYTDIVGPDALTGDTLSISSVLAEGKPVLVDFWASWCGPCRKEIKNSLLSIAANGKVNILGIAVWEESKENTVKAMEELGITWPVIYTGGRENSPSITYGVRGIPTLFLIDSDGTILANGHSAEELGNF